MYTCSPKFLLITSSLNVVKQPHLFTFWILIISTLGLLMELTLIGHYEEFWQYAPMVVLGVYLFAILATGNKKGVSYVGVLKSIFLLTMITGFIGMVLHLKNNLEFELEMYPSIDGWELIKKSLSGALPVLAPGSLIPVGLIGFLLIELRKS